MVSIYLGRWNKRNAWWWTALESCRHGLLELQTTRLTHHRRFSTDEASWVVPQGNWLSRILNLLIQTLLQIYTQTREGLRYHASLGCKRHFNSQSIPAASNNVDYDLSWRASRRGTVVGTVREQYQCVLYDSTSLHVYSVSS